MDNFSQNRHGHLGGSTESRNWPTKHTCFRLIVLNYWVFRYTIKFVILDSELFNNFAMCFCIFYNSVYTIHDKK